MEIIDENMIRQLYFRGKSSEIHVVQSAFLTQSALEYIKEKKLTLIVEDDENKFIHPPENFADKNYVSESGDIEYKEKPEFMTHLYGNVLVLKNHSRIILRGKIDSFIASIMDMQIYAANKKIAKLEQDLGEILKFTQHILQCEVSNQPVKKETLLKYNAEQLRDISHNPRKYFDRGHIKIDYTHGETEVKLNLLRTKSRELEIAGVTAFCSNNKAEHVDILQALNRLSSAIYILMLKNSCRQYQSG